MLLLREINYGLGNTTIAFFAIIHEFLIIAMHCGYPRAAEITG
jgi:hypothetical protein